MARAKEYTYREFQLLMKKMDMNYNVIAETIVYLATERTLFPFLIRERN
jgi:hypothetical protein